jgi:hypothetical protein
MEGEGLIQRFRTDVERVRFPPPARESERPWQPGDPAPKVVVGMSAPDGQWVEVPQAEGVVAIAGFRQAREQRRLAQLKGELSELGLV